MKMKIRLFGAFRKYGSSADFEINPGLTVRELKKVLSRDLGYDFELLSSSAVASEDEVVSDDFILREPGTLALLPPVCGG